MTKPILYSLRRCPYCVRARLALLHAGQQVELRDIVLSNKPEAMLTASAKGTVPVLLVDNTVIDQSLSIMTWALRQNDPQDLLRNNQPELIEQMDALIQRNDKEFVPALESYQAAVRYHDPNKTHHQQRCMPFILDLEQRLQLHPYLMGETPSMVDYALLPFIRKFSRIERRWFVAAELHKLQQWLEVNYQQPHYGEAMKPFPRWQTHNEPTLFG